MVRLELFLLGGFQARLDGAALTAFRSDKVRALLAYLGVENGRDHRREALAALFWPEHDDSSARASLRMALSNLRQLLTPAGAKTLPLLHIDRRAVHLQPHPQQFWLDVACFDAWLDEQENHDHAGADLCSLCIPTLEEALALYQGDFLAGLTIPGSPAFEEWRILQQETHHQRALAGLQTLAQHYLETGAYEQAQRYARQQLALEVWQEPAHRQLILALALSGQQPAALAQYESCRQVLAAELGIDPTAETVALYEAIRDGDIKPGNDYPDTPATIRQRGASRPPHNLPRPVTPFIGREKEVASLRRRLLEPGYRLVTLTGVGGMGKTRLALTVAERVQMFFADGVWFVPLAGVAKAATGEQVTSAANQLATAVATAMGLTFRGTAELRQQLLKQLQTKKLLLLLDNLEPLLADESLAETADFILDLLRQAPGVTLLVTSRRRLALQAEYLLSLDGLALPPADATVAAIGQTPSVRLFLERAERSLGRFEPTPDDLVSIADICRLAAGLPLAIELAATWISHYTPAEIVQAMRRNLDFLSAPMYDLPERHRSMEAVFEGSWQFLNQKEQITLAKLSICRGDFSRDAALVITGASLRELAALVNKSLLRRTTAGRYELHGLLRQFAAGKRAAFNTMDGLELRHSDYYLAFAEARAEAVNSSQSHQILAEIRQELDNVRRAWQWAVANGRYATVERSLKGLQRFYDFAGLVQEGEMVFRTAVTQLEQRADAPPRLLGRLLAEQAYLLTKQGQFAATITVAKRALSQAQRTEDVETEVYSRVRLGYAQWRQGNETGCLGQLEMALQMAEAAGLRLLAAFVLSRFSLIALSAGDYDRAEGYFRQYLDACQAYGDREGEGISYNNLGYIYHARYEYERARDYFERALAIKREMGTRQGEGNTRINLGVIHLMAGEHDRAEVHYKHALQIARDIGEQRLEGLALSNLSLLRVNRGGYERAAAEARQAVALMRQAGDRLTLGYPLTHLGYALTGLKKWSEAEQAFREAIALRREVGQLDSMLESLAGLAQLYLEQGELLAALEAIEPVIDRLQAGLPPGILEPDRLRQTAVRILRAAGDGREATLLALAETAV